MVDGMRGDSATIVVSVATGTTTMILARHR
jgi:hypothetical protein